MRGGGDGGTEGQRDGGMERWRDGETGRRLSARRLASYEVLERKILLFNE